MRQILIVTNPDAYQAERKRGGDVPSMPASRLSELPAGASILVGKRSGLFGGGPTRTGFVMVGAKAVATTAVSPDDAKRGALSVK